MWRLCQEQVYETLAPDFHEWAGWAVVWLHMDVYFISDVSVTGDIGFVSFFEDHTDFAVTTLIKRKSEVDVAITDAVAFFETHYAQQGSRIKRIRSDHGGE